MTDPTMTDGEGAPVETDAQAIIDVATAAASPSSLDQLDSRLVAISAPAGGMTKVVDLYAIAEANNRGPNRKKGAYVAHDADTLVAYLNKHGDNDSEVWANDLTRTLVAVVNAHPDTHGMTHEDHVADDVWAGWEDHRITYQSTKTPAYKAWCEHDGSLLDQITFANHIEDQLSTIVRPDSLDMLEVAQTFMATTGATFKSSQRLASGERKFVFDEDINAAAGRDGEVEVPETFTIRVRPFEGAEVFDVECRLKYRMSMGQLKLGYKIVGREELEREAFDTVVAAVQDGITKAPNIGGIAVHKGAPAS